MGHEKAAIFDLYVLKMESENDRILDVYAFQAYFCTEFRVHNSARMYWLL